jgi:amino acid adenylation domain-containing protein
VARSVEMVASILASIKLGVTFTYLDPSYPEEHQQAILNEVQPDLLVLDEQSPLVASATTKVTTVGELLLSDNLEPIICHSTPESITTVVFTSGSTGKPKGVRIPQAALINRLCWMWEEFPFKEDEVLLLQKSLVLVAATWEYLGGLLSGVTTVIADRQDVVDPSRLSKLCSSHQVTRISGSPSLIQGILDQKQNDRSAFDFLRLVFTSAEPIDTSMVREWQKQFPQVPLWNLYGSSECCSNVTQYNCAYLNVEAVNVPIGSPVPNTTVHIVDKYERPVPIGAIGEMVVSGLCLSDGYLNNREESDERFRHRKIPGSFSDRVYYTGDLARWKPDGTLELTGRSDYQMKLRGYRIQPGEIEHHLLSLDGIREAAIDIRTDDSRGDYLVAFLSGTKKYSNRDIRFFLRKKLPDYMIPFRFEYLDAFPGTSPSSSKLDRRALRDIELTETVVIETDSETGLRGQLLILWRSILSDNTLGCDDGFFDSGGHSLLAAQLCSKIENLTNTSLPVSVLFRAPTVNQFMEFLDSDHEWGQWSSVVSIQPKGGMPPLFCVPPWNGSAICFREIPKHLGDTFPVFGLEPLNSEGKEIPFSDFDELVDFYVKEIQRFHSSNSLYLCGFSGGGMVAWEIARKLRMAGTDVLSLILIDTSKPGIRFSENAENGIILNSITKLRLHLKVLGRMKSPFKMIGYLNRIVSNKLNWWLLGKSKRDLELGIEWEMHKKRDLYEGYTARSYEGDIALMRADVQRHVEASIDRTLVWGSLGKGGFTIYDVPGDHNSLLLEANCAVLGEAFKTHMLMKVKG